MLYTSWPNEPVEKKFENFTKYFLKNKESIKKMIHDSEFGWGRYDRHKPKCSEFKPAPMNSGWTETLGNGWAVWEKSWTFDRIFLEEQGGHKKKYMIPNSGEGDMAKNKAECPVFEPAPMNSNWTEVSGRPHFLPLVWCETLGNWPWRHSKMNYTLALHWTVNEPTQGS